MNSISPEALTCRAVMPSIPTAARGAPDASEASAEVPLPRHPYLLLPHVNTAPPLIIAPKPGPSAASLTG